MKLGEQYLCPLGCKAPLEFEEVGLNHKSLHVKGHVDNRGYVCPTAAGPLHPDFRPPKPYVAPAPPPPPIVAKEGHPVDCICEGSDNDPNCRKHSKEAELLHRIALLEAELAGRKVPT